MAEFRYISADPTFLPGDEAIEKAMEALAPFVESSEVCVTVQAEIEFMHSGPPPKKVACCACHTLAAQEWWKQAVNHSFDTSRCTDLNVTMPCCGAIVSLNELEYSKPAGFARLLLEIRNARREMTTAELHHLEHEMGATLRRI